MRRFSTFYCLTLFVLFLTACTREEVVLTEDDVKARIDSIIRVRTDEVNRRAAEDLDRRSAIEVKVKTDSILDARRGNAPSAPLPADREP